MFGLSREEQLAYLVSQVQESVRGVLGADVGVEEPLMAAGLDSLGAVEVRNSVERKMGTELPSTLVFDYPSVQAMAGFLLESVGGAVEAPNPTDAVFDSVDGTVGVLPSRSLAASSRATAWLPAPVVST
eukprot:jgi/Pico_ML_1/54915/g54.t1